MKIRPILAFIVPALLAALAVASAGQAGAAPARVPSRHYLSSSYGGDLAVVNPDNALGYQDGLSATLPESAYAAYDWRFSTPLELSASDDWYCVGGGNKWTKFYLRMSNGDAYPLAEKFGSWVNAWGNLTGHSGEIAVGIAVQTDSQVGSRSLDACYFNASEQATITPTAMTPTPSSTPFTSAWSLCLTATPVVSATLQATPTPYIARTSTPTPTRTPGGPTATATGVVTPTATPTATTALQQIEWENLSDFSDGLQPWTNWDSQDCPGCSMLRTSHSAEAGADGQPGVAVVGKGLGYSTMVDHWGTNVPWDGGYADPANALGHWMDMMVLALPTDVTRPINVSGAARTLIPMRPGNAAWLYVWYLDPGVGVNGPWWLSRPSYGLQVSHIWGTWGVRITPEDFGLENVYAGSARAVGLAWLVRNDASSGDESYDVNSNALLLDDLKVSIGDNADALLPVCTETGTSGGPGWTLFPDKQTCIVTVHSLDVLSGYCDSLDFACRINIFFTFLVENRQQVEVLQARINSVEPVGTLAEIPQILSVFGGLVSQISIINNRNTFTYRQVDFSQLLNWHALDTPPSLSQAAADTSYLNNCDAIIVNISQTTKAPACWVVETVRKKFTILNLVQWAFDINALIVLFYYFERTWIARNA